MDVLSQLLRPISDLPYAPTTLSLLGLLAIAAVANFVVSGVVLRVVERAVRASTSSWDDVFLARGVLSRLVHIVPALIIGYGIVAIPKLPLPAISVVQKVSFAYVALTLSLAISNLLNAVNELYARKSRHARLRPIKGYVQMGKIVVFMLAAVVILATLLDRSPLLLLSGFGAMSAVLMLVFKDTILSLVASMQLAGNDMLRVGDWIEMPSLDANGDVIDMALNTVKVQNWDKTITTIPTYRLISESFKNWRGMQESGGRRIKRSLLIDQSSVRFLTDAERDDLRRIGLIDEYLEKKRQEIEEYNARLLAAGKDPVNTRRVTNLGTFRAYISHYLRAHPGINQEMIQLVRQLAPGPTGIPLEVYCFTSTVAWVQYENTQSDIFDHLLAILPQFHLRLFQQPGGADLAKLVRREDEEPQPASKAPRAAASG